MQITGGVAYAYLHDPVHHDSALHQDVAAMVACHGAVHLAVVARHHSAPLAQPELLVALLVVNVLEPLPLAQTRHLIGIERRTGPRRAT
jgi:hypothetical protein